MHYAVGAVERAMKRQQIILKAFSGEITWIQAAEILQMTPRNVRRLRLGYQRWGYEGLLDRRRKVPSAKRASAAEVTRVLQLYRERYGGFNVRHFVEVARREHAVTFSYTFIKKALQEAGLVKKGRSRRRHRTRREPKPSFGELLHLDGSRHQWLALKPGDYQTLVVCLDDATKRILYAQLWGGETTEAILSALGEVFTAYGLPMALYTDRAGWAAFTQKSGTKVDKSKPTQVGRVLHKLGIEHILAYSPQARGRSERANSTLQGRLVNELRVAGIRTIETANRYLREKFIERYNESFSRPAIDSTPSFVAVDRSQLEEILCFEETRRVGNDNRVVIGGVYLQIPKQPGRRTCAGLRATVRRHLDRHISVWIGPLCVGRFDKAGRILEQGASQAA